MDPLSDLLTLTEMRSFRVGGFTAGCDWSVLFDAFEGVKCYALMTGTAWIAMEHDEAPCRLSAGDIFLLPHGRPFRIASDPHLSPDDWRLHFLAAPDNSLVALNDGTGVTVLGGHFSFEGTPAKVITGLLPALVHLPGHATSGDLSASFGRLRRELTDAKPGAALVARHLAATILVDVLRLHAVEAAPSTWLSALADRQIGAALAAIHCHPARPWTVSMLASEVGMSRSGFAARFASLVGEGPIEYLTRLRMLVAAKRLATGEALGPVAQSLGYGSDSAFRVAFKRIIGTTPRRHAGDRRAKQPGVPIRQQVPA